MKNEDKEDEEKGRFIHYSKDCKKKKNYRKKKELEYDLDDPFIDDSEITGV